MHLLGSGKRQLLQDSRYGADILTVSSNNAANPGPLLEDRHEDACRLMERVGELGKVLKVLH